MFFTSMSYPEMIAIQGNIVCNDKAYRDTAYNFIVNRSSNYYISESTYTKSDYELGIGTPIAHYDLNVNFKVNTETEKINIPNFVKTIKNNSKVNSMIIKIHRCFHDEGKSCVEKEIVIK